MTFELLKKVDNVEIVDKKTKEKKVIKVTSFYLKNSTLDKMIRIEPHQFTIGGTKQSNKDILSILAVTDWQ